MDFGLDWFSPNRRSDIVGNGFGLTGSYDGSGTKDYFIPEFGFSRSVSPNLALGVVVYGNGGMNTTYNRSPFTAFGGTSPQPIPANQTFFNILAPGVVEDHLTIGATWGVSPNTELTLGYMHAFNKKVNGSGSVPARFGSGNANLQMKQNSLGVTVGWKM